MNEGFSIVQLIIFAGIYAYFAYCLMVIANKTGTENAWLAWDPIANIYLMCKVAGKPAWWLILFIIPLVNIIFAILVWSGIATARGKAGWLGVLVIIPIANLILPGYLAFTD